MQDRINNIQVNIKEHINNGVILSSYVGPHDLHIFLGTLSDFNILSILLYSLRKIYPNLTENQYKRATRKGISKKEFFNIVYGEYYPTRVGNRNISDGGKYYGRGYIQLTGYGNYKRYSELSGVNILSNPELVNDPIIGAKIAAIYFKDRVKANQYDSNYFEKALDAVGYNVGDIRTKKYEYYNCYITKI
jgi:hypothetical protein